MKKTTRRKRLSLTPILLLACAAALIEANAATLTWSVPHQNDDGTPLVDLEGFHVYARSDTNFVAGQDILLTVTNGVPSAPDQGETCSAGLPAPGVSTWYTVTAYDVDGNESPFGDCLCLAVDALPPVILLEGSTVMTLPLGSPYTEPGYSASDEVDGDLTELVQVSGSVNYNTVGTYAIHYNVQDSSGNAATPQMRMVEIIDQTAPVIALVGSSFMSLPRGTPYVEPGYTASDDADGDLTSQVQLSGAVNHNAVGTYVLRYNVQDSSGNDAVERTRSVTVMDAASPTLVLAGSSTMTLPKGTPYAEPGYSAFDDLDGILTAQVIVTGTVNHNTVGTYILQYNVQDSSGNSATASRRIDVYLVESGGPDATSLHGPEGELDPTLRKPLFDWDEVADATWYQIRIMRNGVPYFSKWLEVTAWQPEKWKFEPGTYEWAVQTWNEEGYGPWSETMQFVIDALIPGELVLQEPAGVVATNCPTFSWEQDSEAAWYRLVVHQSGKEVIDRWIEGENQFVPAYKERLRYGHFTWWAQAWGLDGLGPWSEGMDFTYGIPELAGPSGVAAATRPVFSWSKVPGAEWYQIWIALDGKPYYKSWLTESSWVPEWDLPAGDYTWYVQAWNPDGRSPWSEQVAFLVSVSY